MSSKDSNLSESASGNLPNAKDWKFAIAVSEWNEDITNALYKGCVEALKAQEADEANITTVFTPGSFELPFAAKTLIKNATPDAVICLGCVIKGETQHDEYINHAVALGITQLGLATDIPVIFGVLTVNDMQQALDRSGGKYGNKGVECAHTAMKMIQMKKSFSASKKKIGY